MTVKISFAKTLPAKTDTVAAAVYSKNSLSDAAATLDKATDGFIRHYLKQQKKFTGKAGQSLSITAPKGSKYARILLVGLGDGKKLDAQGAETAGGRLFLALSAAGAENAAILSDETADHTAHMAAGLALRSYSFDKYKSKKPDEDSGKLAAVTFVSDDSAKSKTAFAPLEAAVDGVFWARDLINEPPNVLYPESYAKIIRDELKPLGVEVEIFDEKKMQKLGFHAHLAVGLGSEHGPRVVVMRWKGTGAGTGRKASGPLAFVGKGVTFDTGGNNLKPTGSMEDMKMDMAGSAAVVGLMKTLAQRKAKADVVGIVGLAENSISHNSYRPSDIIDSMAGKTIEVLNTDAEGRLVLADALTYVQRTYKPRFVVNLATLTGAMMVALGHEYCGTFVNDDKLWNNLDSAGKAAGEKLWRMPLDEAFRKSMDSPIADMSNVSSMGRYAGACSAAGFLERFVEDNRPWAHMDIAGVAYIPHDKPTCPKKAVGFGVRTLDRLVADHYE